jgi:predicted PurR-regulated permease PerM
MNRATIALSLLLLPSLTYAASAQGLIKNVLTFSNEILLPFLLGIAFLFVVWNAVKFFVIQGATDDGQKNAKNLAIYSVLAFVFIVVFWGLINFLSDSLGLTSTNAPAPDYLDAYPKK